MIDQKVQVYSLGLPAVGTPKDKVRYRVRWRIDGRDRMRKFKTKAQAERLRSQLLTAVRDGLRFDIDSGLPVRWQRTSLTWWEWSHQWFGLKWPQWSGKSRKSGAESLVNITPHLLRPNAPTPPVDLRKWLWEVGYVPARRDSNDPVFVWLQKWSLLLDELDPSALEPALTMATTNKDGSAAAATVAKRRRNAVKSVLSAAVRRGLIDSNPMDRIEWSAPSRAVEIDISLVPSVADVDEIIDRVTGLSSDGACFGAFLALVGYAGLRPSEASRLRLADVELPDEGWGLANLRGAITAPGTRYTNAGGVREDKNLKHRPDDSVRPVPLPPDLVKRLQIHIVRWPPIDGRLFTNGNGRPVTAENYGKVWRRVRAETWPDDHLLAETTAYDLRHSAATTMLRAGVMPSEVGRRLGHSVDVLMRVYAGVFQDERERSNIKIDAEQTRQRDAVEEAR